MHRSLRTLHSLALVVLLLAPTIVFAKVKTFSDISVDVPASFQASASDHGVEMKTPDEEMFVWVETYKPAGEAALKEEHGKYWKEQGVVPKDPETSTKENQALPTKVTDFKGATWNGAPTVLRYYHVGPFGKSDKSILVTLWASPAGDKAHTADLQSIYNSIRVNE